ncbi:30S ribosome-binding factor RbfA [Oleiagrimonas sp.]|jgi:ribosome-binding factor A|uniref:30S ribosome-binding factor RbfA n=1 Tax=Oleiagrimonas sp. TaxID=2010330 RepID=UPI00262E6088|nr:30S ribosome-binding factor RbfA [Oleiagrimonas sp.]MDA3912594.1 30S ribosome-binding factor RbfA [Oleiagrimonas sp.]
MPSRDFKRSDRISAMLRREVGSLVHAAVRDHALPSVSVSDVEATKDLDVATVWVTALDSTQSKTAVKALNELAKEFRRELSHTLSIRRVPELRFKYDVSVEQGERIENLLQQEKDQGRL